MNPDAKVFIDDIEAVKKRAVEYAGFINKLKDRLSPPRRHWPRNPLLLPWYRHSSRTFNE